MTWEPSPGNEDPKKPLKLSVFTLGLMESGKSWRDLIGQRGAECSNTGTLVRLWVPIPLCVPLSLGLKTLFSGCRECTSAMTV